MAVCSRCGANTELHVSGVPVCLKCSNPGERKPPTSDQIRAILETSVVQATRQVGKANREFRDAISKFPGGLPHPDGSQMIKNASNKLNLARNEMMTAHKRLTDFMDRGIVPEDLERNG
jgi:hypothetical protein